MKIGIVGNGRLSKDYGKQIDKCDLVIRFNQATTKGFEKLVGTRTDILALAGETALSYKGAADKLDRGVLQDTKLIWVSGKKKNEDYEEILNKSIYHSFEYINYDDFVVICKYLLGDDFKLQKNPSTGINTLCYCFYKYIVFSNTENKFNIYGFDGFESGHYFNDEKRNNHEFHDLNIERKILEYLKKNKNISFFN